MNDLTLNMHLANYVVLLTLPCHHICLDVQISYFEKKQETQVLSEAALAKVTRD